MRGTVPESFWQLTKLQRVGMGKTSISGTISPSIGNLRQLKILELQGFGIIRDNSSSLANLTKLKTLMLPDKEKLKGEIPRALCSRNISLGPRKCGS